MICKIGDLVTFEIRESNLRGRGIILKAWFGTTGYKVNIIDINSYCNRKTMFIYKERIIRCERNVFLENQI